MVRVRFTHPFIPYQPGDEAHFGAAYADWLAKRGVAVILDDAPAASAPVSGVTVAPESEPEPESEAAPARRGRRKRDD